MTVIGAAIFIIIVCSLHTSTTSFRRAAHYNRLSLAGSRAIDTSRKTSLQLNRLKFINTLFNNFKQKILEFKKVSKSILITNTNTTTFDTRDEIVARGDAGYADDDLLYFSKDSNSSSEREMYSDVNDYDDFTDDYESSYEELFLDQYTLYTSDGNSNDKSKKDNDARDLLKRSMLNFYFLEKSLVI